MTTLVSLLIASIAAGNALTPAQTIVNDYIELDNKSIEYVVDRQFFQENKDICSWEGSYFTFSGEVFCDQIADHFIERRNQIWDLTMKINWYCDEYFNTSDMDLCILRARRDMFKNPSSAQ